MEPGACNTFVSCDFCIFYREKLLVSLSRFDRAHYLCNVPHSTETYIPVLFACLHEPDCQPYVTSDAATGIELKTSAALPMYAAL